MVTAVLQIGRAIGLAVATAIQMAVEKHHDLESATDTPKPVQGSSALLKGLQTAEWFNFALAIAACTVVVCAFRGREKVGAIMK